MTSSEPTGYENEPDECFQPLPAALYPLLYHVQASAEKKELSYYQSILNIRHCRRILELGCGTGRICENLITAGFTVIGIDNSRPMLEFDRRSRQVPVVEMDMHRLGFQSCFDAALIPCNTLNLLGDEQSISHCLNEIQLVLKKQGTLLLHLFVPDRQLTEQPLQKLFQFSLHDLPEQSRLVKESIRTYDPAAERVTLEERFKIRPLSSTGTRKNYTHTFCLTAFSSEKWLQIIDSSGFSIISTHTYFDQSPKVEKKNSMLIVVAQSK